MSEATIFECPYNLFLKQRLEFVVICQDHLEASIMRIVEYEMIKRKEAWQDKATLAVEAKKPPPREPKAYWVRLSQGQIIAKLYLYDSAKLVKPTDEDMESEAWVEYRRKKALSISKSTLRKAIDALIEKGFLLMRSKPGDEFGAPIYTLHHANVQKAMKALPANPYTIFNGWGVSNFESGGESQILKVPPPEIETPTFKNANSHFQNLEVNKDICLESLEDDTREEREGANAPPTPAELLEDVIETHDEVQQELRRITGEHPAVKPTDTESHYHIAGGAIGNEEEPVLAVPRLTLPSKQKPSEQAPGALTGVQAQPLSAPTPAQAEFPPAGSVASGAPTAQASGHIPRRPRGGKPAVLELSLLGMDVKRWYEEIRGAKQRMTAGNVAACNALAECDGMSREALKLVIEHDEKTKYTIDLPALAGTGNEKMRFLSFESVWPTVKRKRNGSQQQAPPQEWVPAENDYSTKAQLWRQELMARSGK